MSLKIEELGYVEEMRQRLGLDENDSCKDKYIESISPLERVRLIAGWYLGGGGWADTFVEYFKSQGLYLTEDPDANGIIEDLF